MTAEELDRLHRLIQIIALLSLSIGFFLFILVFIYKVMLG